jgi:hypothetical protein
MHEATITDVTALLSSERQQVEEDLFELLQEAFAVATSRPSVRTYRACVAAFDEYYRAVCEGVRK